MLRRRPEGASRGTVTQKTRGNGARGVSLFGATRQRKRQAMPPARRSIGVGPPPPTEVHPLGDRARVTVDEPQLADTWLIQIAGTTADPTIFPPDRTLPQLAFDFRDLEIGADEDALRDDPFARFRDLLAAGLREAFRRRTPRHLVFVGHSFGGMASIDFLLHHGLEGLQAMVPSLERVTLTMACAAHVSPMDRYKIRSDTPVVGPVATWLSHHVTRLTTASRGRMATVKGLIGHEQPRPLWRDAWTSTDELSAVWRLPRASSLDHFWSVVRCANAYDVPARLRGGGRLWFDLLLLSAELDTQWPADMFESFWRLIEESDCPRARWCHFPGDDHLSVARQPTKYYKELKDFLLAGRVRRAPRIRLSSLTE